MQYTTTTIIDSTTTRLHDALLTRAAAERNVRRCKPGSPWHKRYVEEEQNARNRAAAEQTLLDALNLVPQANAAARRIGAECSRFLVCDPTKPKYANGQFSELLDNRRRSEVLIQFCEDVHTAGITLESGKSWDVILPTTVAPPSNGTFARGGDRSSGATYIVEVR